MLCHINSSDYYMFMVEYDKVILLITVIKYKYEELIHVPYKGHLMYMYICHMYIYVNAHTVFYLRLDYTCLMSVQITVWCHNVLILKLCDQVKDSVFFFC